MANQVTVKATSQKQLNHLLKIAHEVGVKWASGHDPLEPVVAFPGPEGDKRRFWLGYERNWGLFHSYMGSGGFFIDYDPKRWREYLKDMNP